MHETVNRWLTTVALILGIAALIVFLYAAVKVNDGLSGFSDSPAEPAMECWDPGGGEICAPGGEDGI